MNFESVRSIIDTYIKKNGVEAITGDILNNVLNTMLDDVDTAISSIEPSPGGGSGEGGVSEEDVLNILEKNAYATQSWVNEQGFAKISDYYTKAQSDAMYLALSGGTISGDTDALKIVRNTNGYSAITYYNTQNGATTLLGVMGFDSNGEPSAYRASDNAWRTLIHSGNIGSYAMKWMGNDGYRDLNTFSYDAGVFGSFYSPNAPSGVVAYAVLNLPYRRNAEKPDFMAQILIPNGDDADTNMYYRTSLADSWNPWRKVISTADDGYIYGLGGYIDIQYSDEINRYGGNLYLQHRGVVAGEGTGGNYTGHIIMCANGGNVGIGTTSPSYKLDVYGDSRINGNLIVSGDVASA